MVGQATRINTRRQNEIMGYSYCAGIYCPQCMVHKLELEIKHRTPSVKIDATLDPEYVMDMLSEVYGVNRNYEHSFSSDEFPKFIFSSGVTADMFCDDCWDYIPFND